MPGPGQKPHPRAVGAFPKALRMAREMGIPLTQIVHRLSTSPCRFPRLEDPVLREGADASLVLFDWDTAAEMNDYLNPPTPPRGIDGVWIHGVRVSRDGAVEAPPRPFPGKILKTALVAA